MSGRKQGAGLSSGSSAAVHKVNCLRFYKLDCESLDLNWDVSWH